MSHQRLTAAPDRPDTATRSRRRRRASAGRTALLTLVALTGAGALVWAGCAAVPDPPGGSAAAP
ncbi:hypothetical protein ACWF94_16690, partial [Streptomyces sp. NPDC055078]